VDGGIAVAREPGRAISQMMSLARGIVVLVLLHPVSADGCTPTVDEVYTYVLAPGSVPVPTLDRSAPAIIDPEAAAFVRTILRSLHLHATRQPINVPDQAGCFPGSSSLLLLRATRGTPIVTPDACVLGNDVGYACRTGSRTTLVNAANTSAVRVICARHVIQDVLRHAEEYASRYCVSRDVLVARLCAEYLPLLRVVRDVPADWFGPVEADRVARLIDRDDAPSVRLAIALGSCYISEDRPALRAVYGDAIDFDRHHAWVDLLKAGGDAGELEQGLLGGAMLAALAGYPAVAGVRRLSRTVSPWGVAAIVAVAVGAAWRTTSSDAKWKWRRCAATAGRWLGQVVGDYSAAVDRFNAAAASTPDWEALSAQNEPMAVLQRASLFALARAPASHLSAV